MPHNFLESDWKILSHLKPLALDRLCQRILQESGKILDHAKEGGSHSAYLELYKHIHTSDETLSNCFDDMKRSRAWAILINWKLEGLLTDEEFNAFSSETREMVGVLLKRVQRRE
jgi:hypothetical protein